MGVEEVGTLGVLDLIAGAELVGFAASPGLPATDVAGLVTDLFTEADKVDGLGFTAFAAGGACFGVPFVALEAVEAVEADAVTGLELTIFAAGNACFGAPFIALGAVIDGAAGLVVVPKADSGVVEVGF